MFVLDEISTIKISYSPLPTIKALAFQPQVHKSIFLAAIKKTNKYIEFKQAESNVRQNSITQIGRKLFVVFIDCLSPDRQEIV